jgi:hypothetical protein
LGVTSQVTSIGAPSSPNVSRREPRKSQEAKNPENGLHAVRSNFLGKKGADYWTRTNDLLITNELLYQLS